jgi:CheY-like chemotaxis protein
MGGRIILVVEDNEINLKLVRTLLQMNRFDVIEAGNAEEGIELAKKHRPSLILMDVQLPGMDGYAATRILKQDESLKEIPVVALTAHAMVGHERKAFEAGCSGYITKPIDIRAFPRTIEVFLSRDPGFRFPITRRS